MTDNKPNKYGYKPRTHYRLAGDLTKKQQWVLLYLSDTLIFLNRKYTKQRARVGHSLDHIGEKLGITPRGVQNMINALEKKGYIRVKRGEYIDTCLQQQNRYFITSKTKRLNMGYRNPRLDVTVHYKDVEYVEHDASKTVQLGSKDAQFNYDMRGTAGMIFSTRYRPAYNLSYLEHNHPNEDYYFLGGTRDLKGRKNEDIKKKTYFFVDIDIRKTIDPTMTDSQLNNRIATVKHALDKDYTYRDYSYIVNSGNGMHVYYSGREKTISPDTYKNGVKFHYLQIDKILAPLGLSCDHACSNIARLARAPGTINTSSGTLCHIQYYKQSSGSVWENVTKYAVHMEYRGSDILYDRVEEVEERKRERAMQKEERDGKFYCVAKLFESISDVRLKRDGRNFSAGGNKKNIGAFYIEKDNIIINVGTHRLGKEKAYNPYTLAQEHLGTRDPVTIFTFLDEYALC